THAMAQATVGRRRTRHVASDPIPVETYAPVAPEPARRRRVVAPALAVAGGVLFGVALRGTADARNHSPWIDEAMLAVNVVYRPTAELLQPLDMNQGAPVGFLVLSRLTVSALGRWELVLRLGPFVAALVGLALFVPLAYRALPRPAARLAVC